MRPPVPLTRMPRNSRRARRSVPPRQLAAPLLAAITLIAAPVPAAAQTVPSRWRIDPKASLAWWQIDPHYNHLWATTCPEDPSWQPGEGRSSGYYIDYALRPKTRDTGYSDSRIPLYPRGRVRGVCSEAVTGTVTAADPAIWSGVHGTVVVAADRLITGLRLRDKYARSAVLETGKYPEVRFTVDSLVAVQPGDTIRAVAAGTLEVHGVQKAVSVPVRAWHDGGGLRVLGQFQFPAPDLVYEYGMSRMALGLGVILGRWKTVHLGADLVLRPEAETNASGP